MLAVIGGSGFETFKEFEVQEECSRKTPFGQTSSGLKFVKIQGHKLLFLPRHGISHELLPSEVNYRANIYALKTLGTKAILSFSAVGSLNETLRPGDMVIVNQYIDRTKSLRASSFTGKGVVAHVSLADPVCKVLSQKAYEVSQQCDFTTYEKKTYVCIEGPYFSTKAESQSYRALKADVIGMTNFPEYALAKEAGLAYLPCCFVTDYDCWKEDVKPVEIEHVMEVMKNNNKKSFEFLKLFLKEGHVWKNSKALEKSLKSGLLTPFDKLPLPIKNLLS